MLLSRVMSPTIGLPFFIKKKILQRYNGYNGTGSVWWGTMLTTTRDNATENWYNTTQRPACYKQRENGGSNERSWFPLLTYQLHPSAPAWCHSVPAWGIGTRQTRSDYHPIIHGRKKARASRAVQVQENASRSIHPATCQRRCRYHRPV